MNYFDVKIFILKVCTLPLEKGKIFSNYYKKINLLMLRIKPFSLLKINKIYLDKYIQINKFKKNEFI